MKIPSAKKPPVTDLRKFKFLIYGQPGAGKSTLASRFPDAIFVPTEPGLNFLECAQICDDDGNPTICRSWSDLKSAIKAIVDGNHGYKTVVIDTVDNAWEFCALETLKKLRISHESEGNFGSAYSAIKREFTKEINYVANSGYGLVFISHVKQIDRDEDGAKQTFTDNSLPGQAKNYINGLVDFIFYCAIVNQKRMMRTKASDKVNAKDRSGRLPEVMEMDFNALIGALTNKVEEKK